jgi:hypothetical protein
MSRAALIAVLTAAVLAPAAHAETITFSVMSVVVSAKPTDVPPKGASKGDKILERDRLVNTGARFGRAKGAVVGTDHGTLTFTSTHTARYSGTVVLPDGTIKLAGSITLLARGSLRIKVVGGTGRYAKATGSVVVGPGDKRSLNTYRLTLPSGANIA